MLKFSRANAKLQRLAKHGKVYSLDLPAGKTCPGALKCQSSAIHTMSGWRIQDHDDCEFRCYAAMAEAIFPKTRKLRAHNHRVINRLRTAKQIAEEILKSLPENCTILRLHASGDFFKRAYFNAILICARKRPDILFYGYTKAIPFWVDKKQQVARLPNLMLTASLGGKYDSLAKSNRLRTCRVVLSTEEAESAGLEIDHDDTLACGIASRVNFAVLIHGVQPLGSSAGKAVYRNRQMGVGGYRRKGYGYGSLKKG